MVLAYLVERFFYRIGEFLRHWYVKSARIYWHFVINRLEQLDYTFAWKVTLQNLFQPLYKDYSFIGYILGFCFRLIRLVVASGLYTLIFAIAGFLYLVWLLVPPFLLLRVISTFI